mmetsp:Transcript_29834/g.69049  ORF Transcript_29834/g.69049 Transcript_29834/m.69049 type:complete len:201 (-) Transcript_29834:193-795(-)
MQKSTHRRWRWKRSEGTHTCSPHLRPATPQEPEDLGKTSCDPSIHATVAHRICMTQPQGRAKKETGPATMPKLEWQPLLRTRNHRHVYGLQPCQSEPKERAPWPAAAANTDRENAPAGLPKTKTQSCGRSPQNLPRNRTTGKCTESQSPGRKSPPPPARLYGHARNRNTWRPACGRPAAGFAEHARSCSTGKATVQPSRS